MYETNHLNKMFAHMARTYPKYRFEVTLLNQKGKFTIDAVVDVYKGEELFDKYAIEFKTRNYHNDIINGWGSLMIQNDKYKKLKQYEKSGYKSIYVSCDKYANNYYWFNLTEKDFEFKKLSLQKDFYVKVSSTDLKGFGETIEKENYKLPISMAYHFTI
jgi:hypothetical protein